MADLLNLYQPQLRILAEVVLAAFLGALIGFDREMAEKPAGLRTHMLVGSAAALVVGLSNIVVQQFMSGIGESVIRTDPIRIMEAVITGVSFLGAGTILRHKSKNKVEGLTTAASLLVAAAIGISVALSQIVLAVGTTITVLIALRGIKILEGWLDRLGAT